MYRNGKDTKHTTHISRKNHLVINGEEYNFQKMVWWEGGLQLSDIVTKNDGDNELNNGLGYAMVRLDNW